MNVREVIVKSRLLKTNSRRLSLQAKNSIDITLLVRSTKLSPLNSLRRVDAKGISLDTDSRDGNGRSDNAGDGERGEELHCSECVNERMLVGFQNRRGRWKSRAFIVYTEAILNYRYIVMHKATDMSCPRAKLVRAQAQNEIRGDLHTFQNTGQCAKTP